MNVSAVSLKMCEVANVMCSELGKYVVCNAKCAMLGPNWCTMLCKLLCAVQQQVRCMCSSVHYCVQAPRPHRLYPCAIRCVCVCVFGVPYTNVLHTRRTRCYRPKMCTR